jgi:DNA-binding NtrC family response regulator
MDSNQTPKARVLFVDDEPRVLTTMRILFRGRYELFFAESGQQALELLKSQAVDVIVSDQRMPGMTGIELLRAARELNPHAMRILLTGYSDLNAIIGSINEGEIFRFVNKPWSNDDLTTTLQRAVAAAQVSQSVAAHEAGANVGAADTVPAENAAGVLVVDDDPQVPPRIQTVLGPEYRVFGATSMEEAVGALERERIGVIVSDTRVQDHPVINLIGTLKQHHPELVSVILTERADAGSAIDLINQGQIYRFITKPIQDSQCKIAVTSAVRQHQRLASAPELTQRYEVERIPEPPPSSQLATMAGRIKTLRTWVRRWV